MTGLVSPYLVNSEYKGRVAADSPHHIRYIVTDEDAEPLHFASPCSYLLFLSPLPAGSADTTAATMSKHGLTEQAVGLLPGKSFSKRTAWGSIVTWPLAAD